MDKFMKFGIGLLTVSLGLIFIVSLISTAVAFVCGVI